MQYTVHAYKRVNIHTYIYIHIRVRVCDLLDLALFFHFRFAEGGGSKNKSLPQIFVFLALLGLIIPAYLRRILENFECVGTGTGGR